MSEYLSQGVDEVPDFTATGLTDSSEVAANAETFNAALATLQDVEALAISGCVTASVSGNQICFTIPIFGRFCFPSPVRLPVLEGETEFFYQRKKVIPKAGSVLIAPTAFTHTHRGNRPSGGDKYIATSWILFNRAEQIYGSGPA